MNQLDQTNNHLPAVPLRGGAVFPGITTTISIGRPRSLAAVHAAVEGNGRLLILTQYDASRELPGDEDLAPIAILATVHDVLRIPNNSAQMLVELSERVQFEQLESHDPYLIASYSELENIIDDDADAPRHHAIAYLEQYAEALGETNQQVLANTRAKRTAGDLGDYIAGLLNLPFEMELDLLTELDGRVRLSLIIEYLKEEISIAHVRNNIQAEARDSADEAQKSTCCASK